ncbi:hypothetical protein [Actinokineospora sp. HUAS TT18]|uniref:hypothetical protein n=1 Tax=Actinokineospora sp. HUAS TT18 TaxID=3447451 RepID=UPI003F52158F
MSTITTRCRRGVVAVAALAAACMTATLVPTQAIAETRDEWVEYPAPPPPDSMRETPALAGIAKDATDTFKYALATVAANQDPAAYREGTVEYDLVKALEAAPGDVREKAKAASTALLGSKDSIAREFGKSAALSPEEFAKLGFDGAFDKVGSDQAGLRADIVAIATRIEREARAEEAAHQQYLKLNNIPITAYLPRVTDLRLRLQKVRCVEETDWNALGSDEIAMGAVSVDNEGTTKKVSKFDIPESGGFDNGDVYTYTSPGKSYVHFPINPGAFPRKYVVTMMMAEVDNGGFADILNLAWAKVKDKVQQVIAQAVAGLTSPFIGPALAEALGQIVAWLVTTFVGWIISLFYDDLFKPVTVSVKLPSRWAYKYDNGVTSGWDNLRTGTHTSTFYQDTGDTSADGIYKANIHWELQTS